MRLVKGSRASSDSCCRGDGRPREGVHDGPPCGPSCVCGGVNGANNPDSSPPRDLRRHGGDRTISTPLNEARRRGGDEEGAPPGALRRNGEGPPMIPDLPLVTDNQKEDEEDVPGIEDVL